MATCERTKFNGQESQVNESPSNHPRFFHQIIHKSVNCASMFSPSAPDIAGQNKANPLAAILSFAMACRFSLDLSEIADHIEASARAVLGQGIRTGDIMSANCTQVSTTEMGDALINEMKTRLKKAA